MYIKGKKNFISDALLCVKHLLSDICPLFACALSILLNSSSIVCLVHRTEYARPKCYTK